MPLSSPLPSPSILARSVGMLLALAAANASAQTDTATTTSQDNEPIKNLAKVTVKSERGKKRVAAGALGTLSAVDTPYSTTSISSEVLQAKQAVSLAQAFAADASVSSGGSDYTPYSNDITIRGLPLDLSNGVKLNGLPFESYAINLPLELMDSVELLKGASAFMYGFAAPGGTVNYVTKKTPEEGSMLSVDAGYRSSNLYSEHVDAGTRFGENQRYGVRANLYSQSGTSAGNVRIDKNYSASLALDARVNEALTATFDALYLDSNVRGQAPGGFYTLDSGYLSSTTPRAISGDTAIGASTGFVNNHFLYLSSGLHWTLPADWKLDLTAAYTSSRSSDNTDWIYFTSRDGDYYNSRWGSAYADRYKYVQALLSGSVTTGAVRHDLSMGLSYNRHSEDSGNAEDYESGVGYGNLYDIQRDSWYLYAGQLVPSFLAIEKSVFFSDTLHMGEHWMAIVGLRYTDFSETTWSTAQDGDTITNAVDSTYHKYPVSPTLALMYKPTSHSTVYASYVQSLEKGSVVGITYTNVGEVLAPITSKQYELGYKLDTAQIDAALAVYRLDKGAEYGDSSGAYVSGGIRRYQGIDASVNWHASQALTLGASLLRLQAHYLQVGSDWLEGRTVYGATPLRAVVSGNYRVDSVPGLSVRADVRYSEHTRVTNNAVTEVTVDTPDYTLVNGGMVYVTTMGGRTVTFTGGVNNLLDKTYWSTGQQAFFLGAARTYFSNIKIDF